MNKLKCIAIDDEPLALELIVDNIKRIEFLECIGTFNSAIKAEEFINSTSVDLLFLDIQMPAMSGVEFARKLNDKMFIFTTAFENYALEGFELSAIDYILKPIRFDRFEMACAKAKEWFELKRSDNQNKENSIIIRSEHSFIKLMYADVLYIEGLKDYVKIHVKNSSKPHLTRCNLKTIGDKLPFNKFKRVHKSYIVNTDSITKIETDKIQLSSLSIPLGEAYKNELRSLFKS